MQSNVKQLVQTHARRVWFNKVLDCVASQTRDAALTIVHRNAAAAVTYPAIATIVIHAIAVSVNSEEPHDQ